MNKTSEIKIRQYAFTEGEIKEALKIKGRIMRFGLWAGLSPNDEEKNVSSDQVEWLIETKEGKELE